MGRWLKELKEKKNNLPPNELKKPQKVPFFSFFSSPKGVNAKNRRTIQPGDCCSEQYSIGQVRDPFDSTNYPPPGWIVCIRDRDKPDQWIARRVGSLEREGQGRDQVDAVLDLERLESDGG